MSAHLYPDFPVLLVDDEEAWLRSLSLVLERSVGITNLVLCSDSRRVLELLAEKRPGLVLLDLIMPYLSGEELLGRVTEEHPEVAVIVITGMDQVDTAVRCMRAGAFDYYVKTVEEGRLAAGVQRAVRMLELQRENQRLQSGFFRDELSHPEAFAGIVTAHPAMRSVFTYVEAVAASPQPVLITGESGTGKELISLAIHRAGGRSGDWVPVNVAGLDDTLFSDTLFGHVRGAFTGADTSRQGMVAQAAGGTLFLDEIGDLNPVSQMKLLRLLEDGEYCPLGRETCLRSDARVVVATNQDLSGKLAAGQFRKDLYFRLKAHHVHLPPLRERSDDIPPLLDHFLAKAARELNKPKPVPPRQLPVLLGTYSFPGNVRELRSMVFDAVSLHRGGTLSLTAFKKAMGLEGRDAGEKGLPAGEEPELRFSERLPTFKEALNLLMTEALRRTGGNQSQAARLLGISRPALCKRLKKLKANTDRGVNPG